MGYHLARYASAFALQSGISNIPRRVLHTGQSIPRRHLSHALMYPQQAWLWSIACFLSGWGGSPHIAHPPPCAASVSWYHCSVTPNLRNRLALDSSRTLGLLFFAQSSHRFLDIARFCGSALYAAIAARLFGSTLLRSRRASIFSGFLVSHFRLSMRAQLRQADISPCFMALLREKLLAGWRTPARWQSFLEHSFSVAGYNDSDEGVMPLLSAVGLGRSWETPTSSFYYRENA